MISKKFEARLQDLTSGLSSTNKDIVLINTKLGAFKEIRTHLYKLETE